MRLRSRSLPLALAAVAALLAAAGGCRSRNSALASETLTPEQFQLLSDKEKIQYRDVVLRIPEAWGGTLLPFTKGPFPTPLEKAVQGGQLDAIMAQYNRSLFELEHPRVKVEFVNFDMWSDNFRPVLAVSLKSHRAPAVYVARDLPQTIYDGIFADITDLLKTWDQAKQQPEGSVREGTVEGRTYTIAGNELGGTVIRYRKDWFREAGIFNEYGEPGPPSNWTWDDFRRIAKKLTDPSKNRWGFAGQTDDFFYNDAHGFRPYVPDRTGRHNWRFNDQDPQLMDSLKAARAMVQDDKSVSTSVTMGWFEWHAEFDAGRAGMVQSFAPHIPNESLSEPNKFGTDKPFAQTVGMALLPSGPTGLNGFHAVTNNFGFDPTQSAEQLRAAFDWTKSYFYGPIFENNLRAQLQSDRALGKRSTAYATLLCTPYRYDPRLLDVPLSSVFPRDYLRLYARIRSYPAPPLPREFGLHEPPTAEWDSAIKAMYSKAELSPNVDLKAVVRDTADVINNSVLNFPPDKNARSRMRRYYAALGQFYQRHFPEFYRTEWPRLYAQYYRVDGD